MVLQQPEQFKCLIPMLGEFHMVKAFVYDTVFYCTFSKMNCLFDTLIESGTFGVKAVGEVAKDTHYVRSFRDMLILSEALLNSNGMTLGEKLMQIFSKNLFTSFKDFQKNDEEIKNQIT